MCVWNTDPINKFHQNFSFLFLFRSQKSSTSVSSGTPDQGSTPDSRRLVTCLCQKASVRATLPPPAVRNLLLRPQPEEEEDDSVCFLTQLMVQRLLMSLLTDGLSDRKWCHRWLLVRKLSSVRGRAADKTRIFRMTWLSWPNIKNNPAFTRRRRLFHVSDGIVADSRLIPPLVLLCLLVSCLTETESSINPPLWDHSNSL